MCQGPEDNEETRVWYMNDFQTDNEFVLQLKYIFLDIVSQDIRSYLQSHRGSN